MANEEQMDPRIVSGARCVWFGKLSETSLTPSGLPCCPHCGGVLFEVPNEDAWWSGVMAFEATGAAGYTDMIRWSRGKHFRSMEELQRAYSSADTTPPPMRYDDVQRPIRVAASVDDAGRITLPVVRTVRLVKHIVFCGQRARVECDAKCSKAWGINTRERVQVGTPEDIDDYAWLSDDELGDAPADPGRYEGGQAKPSRVDGPADMNKWCVRECERSRMTDPGAPDAPIELRDFSRRVYNRPSSDPRHRDSKE